MTERTLLSFAKPFVERFPRLAATYRFYRDAATVPNPIQIPRGYKFDGNEVMASGNFEVEEGKLFDELLKDADVFIDIGANVGYYCCESLKAGIHTVAFEPIEGNLRYLYANIASNAWREKVEVFPVAVGDRNGVAEIYGGGTGASLLRGWANNEKEAPVRVPIFTLDTILGNRFSGSKIVFLVDVEGFEKSVIDGALEQLARDPRPAWLVEISVSEHQPSDVSVNPNLLATFEEFWKHGYKAFTATSDRRLVTREEIESIVTGGPNTLGTHNFLFK